MRSLNSLDWPKIIARLEHFATSEVAREQLRQLQPLANQKAALSSFDEIDEARTLIQLGHRPFMESLDLFSLWHQRLSREAVLKPLELKDVRHFCLECIALMEILRPIDLPWLKAQRKLIMDASEPLSAIDQLMTPDGDIRTDASETLYKLYNEKQQQARLIQSTLDGLVKQHEMEPILQDKYVTNREGRWVLPVKSGMQHSFDGIIHASSQSKQTVFMEPKDIVPINNRLRQIETEIEQEIERLLTELSRYLTRCSKGFEQTRAVMLELDKRLAQAQLAAQLNAVSCRFDDYEIELNELRNPALALNNEKVIPNSVILDATKRILLLSGPNAGGKTILLKAVGLAAQMARCGLPICAEENSKLPFFSDIHVAVGDSQNVDAQLSTFAAHLTVLNEATRAQGPKQLLLIDEICGSTDPEEGTALARSFIETYAANKVFGVITSHLGPLKLGWKDDSGVANGSLEYDKKTGRPTYQFIMGVPGQSLALQTAQRVGVSETIIEQAKEYLSPEMKRYLSSLEEVEEVREELIRIKQKLSEESKAARQAKEKYLQLADKFNRDRDQMLEQSIKRAEKKVERLIETAKVQDVFKKHSELEKMKSQLPQVVKSTKSGPTTARKIESAEQFAKAYPPGSKVFVSSLGRDGVIQGGPNSKGEIPVLSNSIRMSIHWESLKPPHQAQNPTTEIVRKTKHFSISPADSDRVVDLRGLSVEEALGQLEVQLDTAALNKEERVKVIHGHGTEALKKSVRGYLSRSVYVQKWKAGTPQSGGDGVTWIEIK